MKIVLNDIIELIGDLNLKIKTYGDKLSRNEALVRSALIEPFLRSLGWDTSDPSQVIPEFFTDAGKPDYALFSAGKSHPLAFLGAKKLGKGEDISQHISYCVEENVDYFIATDGQKWEVYDTFKKVRPPEKKICEWDIVFDDPSEIAIKALTIANLTSFGNPANIPLVQLKDKLQPRKEEATFTAIPLMPRRVGPERRGPLRPISLTINGKKFEVNKSNQILIETAEWLIKEGKLTKQNVPIESGPDRWLINTKSIHRNGKEFFSAYKLSNGLFLEMNYGSERIKELASNLMKHCGYGEDSLVVEWEK